MIRPFDWRDLPLLHRVHGRGICFHARLEKTRGAQFLQNVLLDIVTAGRNACTFVNRPLNDEEEPSVGQLVHLLENPLARLTFISPAESLAQPSGLRLLEALIQFAGQRGAHHLIADVDEHSPAFETLRQAGFAIYSRQRLWRMANVPMDTSQPPQDPWQAYRLSDQPAVDALYLSLVPGLVQQVEQAPALNEYGLVYWVEDELLGFLDIDRGPRGIWVQPYLHPAAEKPDHLLMAYLSQHAKSGRSPLVFCVRSNQAWIGNALERSGFEPCGDQAVMVKRIAVAVRRPALGPLPAIERTSPEPTAPIATLEQHEPASYIDGGL